MKKYIYTLIFLVPSVLIGQLSMHTYVEVQEQNADEFEKREKLYWSKVAEKNIEEGVLVAWGLLKQVGVFGGAANYVHVKFMLISKLYKITMISGFQKKLALKKKTYHFKGLEKLLVAPFGWSTLEWMVRQNLPDIITELQKVFPLGLRIIKIFGRIGCKKG